ncbi:hypothetical protein PYW08_007275 [Mythimna loreyi]|uniref:Uncharacterized protein n=1 Tax=Mythimna loreyi TaxID=667449 RepID=A0ACC2R978_9NEOP|nr:hypothetical protein PYW08_007275 [Mythimna loreyi]
MARLVTVVLILAVVSCVVAAPCEVRGKETGSSYKASPSRGKPERTLSESEDMTAVVQSEPEVLPERSPIATQRCKRPRYCLDSKKAKKTPPKKLTSKLDEILEKVNAVMSNQCARLDALEEHIREVKQQNDDTQTNSAEIMKSIEFFGARLSDLENQIHGMEQERKEIAVYLSKIDEKIDRLERNAIKTSVEIRNVPKIPKETKMSLYDKALKLFKSLGSEIPKSDVRDVYRAPSKSSDSKSTIIVEFADTLTKSNFLGITKDFNNKNPSNRLNTFHLGIGGEKHPIFISEHLTAKMKRFHFLARDVAKYAHYEHC